MISVVICSRRSNLNHNLRNDIANTIGTNYELIVIDNSENIFDIYEAYNKGIGLCKGSYICFVHDDVRFLSCNWGLILESIFKRDPEIGVIALSGSRIKSRMPSSWWGCDSVFHVQNIVQDYPDGSSIYYNSGFDNSNLVDVVTIDGVFMALRNDVNAHFETSLSGFHNYDLYLAINYINLGFRVVITNDVLIQHFSLGNINQFWYKSAYELYSKFKHNLPMSSETISCTVMMKTECVNYINYIKSSKCGISIWKKFKLTIDMLSSLLFFGIKCLFKW